MLETITTIEFAPTGGTNQDLGFKPVSCHKTLRPSDKISKMLGFTLAEVLISLGIIGIVSALTIPTLVKKYQQDAWNISADIFYQKLLEATKVMNAQSVLTGHETTESFVNELSKHFKIIKTCSNEELLNCFSEKVYWGGGTSSFEEVDMSIIKTTRNFGQNDWKTNIVGVQFANGVNSLIAYNPTKSCIQNPLSNQITGEDCFAILYDTTGDKLPNTKGKDLRANRNVSKLGKGCFAEINKICVAKAPFKPTPVTKVECEKMIPTHGIQTCKSDSDFWAGAVKTCGGVKKMATQEQLAEIANYVYNTDIIKTKGTTTGLTFDKPKATELGLPEPTFQLWSNKEVGESYAFYQRFNSDGTTWYNGQGNYSLLAICVEN